MFIVVVNFYYFSPATVYYLSSVRIHFFEADSVTDNVVERNATEAGNNEAESNNQNGSSFHTIRTALFSLFVHSFHVCCHGFSAYKKKEYATEN